MPGNQLDLGVKDVNLTPSLGRCKSATSSSSFLGRTCTPISRLGIPLPQCNLGQDLVAKGSRHDEGGMTLCTSQIHQTTLSKQDDASPRGQSVSIDLGFDIVHRDGIRTKPCHINLHIKMSNVANNCIIRHIQKMFGPDDISTTQLQ